MLQRKITKVLQAWKQETHKPCLLIRGARQVGKTFIKDNCPSVRRWIKFEPDINLTRDEKDIEHYPLFMAMFL